MKKFFMILLAVCLLVGTVALVTACNAGDGNGNETATETGTTPDTTVTETETETEAETEAGVVGTYAVVFVDQDGAAVPDVEVTLLKGSEVIASATSDAEGKISGAITLSGTYTMQILTLPAGYLADLYTQTVTVTPEAPTVTVTVINNVPNGSTERPFFLMDVLTETEIPAGATYWYQMRGMDRTLKIEGAQGLTVTYDGNTYEPDENGLLTVSGISAPRANEYVSFAVTNAGADVKAVTLDIRAPLGSSENPIVITDLTQIYFTQPMGKEEATYYTWTATKNGMLAVFSDDIYNNITLYNTASMVVTGYTEGGSAIYVPVSVGDEVSIVVSVYTAPEELGGAETEAETEVETGDAAANDDKSVRFAVMEFEGTEADPVLVGSRCALRIEAGKTLFLRCTDPAWTAVTVEGQVKVAFNGTVYEESDGVTLAWGDGTEAIFSVTNNGTTHVTVSLTGAKG